MSSTFSSSVYFPRPRRRNGPGRDGRNRQLHPLGERAEHRLEAGMVAARSAMDEKADAPFGHACAVGHQAHALDVEIQFCARTVAYMRRAFSF